MSAQDLCNELAYPPTHTFDADTLTPTGVLAERAALIAKVAPDLFEGTRFLDVGCNKGWFSLKAAQSCQDVLGIDPVPEYVDIARSKAPSNCKFRVDSFGTFNPIGTYDRVFIGNGPHYPFVESGGWGFVEKLAEIASDLVVTEGPLGMDCRDMATCIPDHLKNFFNAPGFHGAMGLHFDLSEVSASPSYTPDRYIMAWRRIDDLLRCPMSRYADYLRIVYKRMAKWIDPFDSVVEVCIRHDRGVITTEEIECEEFTGLDRDPSRCPKGGYKADAIHAKMPFADVYISTAILHHTNKSDIPQLLKNIHKHAIKRAIFTGPNARVMPQLFGDHKWHIDLKELAEMADATGWKVIGMDPVGLNPPYSEVMIVMDKA